VLSVRGENYKRVVLTPVLNDITGVRLVDFSLASSVIHSEDWEKTHCIYICSDRLAPNVIGYDNGPISLPVIGILKLLWSPLGAIINTQFTSYYYPTQFENNSGVITMFDIYLVNSDLRVITVADPSVFKYTCVFKLITNSNTTYGE